MQIARLTSSCVTLPRSTKPGGNPSSSAKNTRSQASRSWIVCTAPRCMTPSSTCLGLASILRYLPGRKDLLAWSLRSVEDGHAGDGERRPALAEVGVDHQVAAVGPGNRGR